MRYFAAILLSVLLASCAGEDPVPPAGRTDIPKAVPVLDLSKVEKSGADVSDAADRVAAANAKAQTTAQQLKASMERARAYEQGGELFRQAWEESERFAAQLAADLEASDAENANLKQHVATLKISVAVAQAENTARDVLITQQFDGLVRAYEDIKSLNKVRDDLVASNAKVKELKIRKDELLIESGKKSFQIGCLIAGCAVLAALSGYLAVRVFFV